MALTVITPYVSNRVSDPVTVELQTGLRGRTAERLLDVVSSMFASYCDRVFAKQRYRETIGVEGGDPRLQLGRVPLVYDETTRSRSRCAPRPSRILISRTWSAAGCSVSVAGRALDLWAG